MRNARRITWASVVIAVTALASLTLGGCGGASTSAAQNSSPSPSSSSSSTTAPTTTTTAPTTTVKATGTAQISWTPPTTTADGSTLLNLAGYYIYYGTSPGSLTQQIQVSNVGVTTYDVGNLSSGTWYFVVTAYTADGAQSAPSNVLSHTIS